MIKGISDKTRLQRAGKIRGGIKKLSKSGKEYPASTEFFVVPDEVAAVVGSQPKKLPIKLPYNTIEQNFPQFLKSYKGGTLYCKGDGETASRLEDGEIKEIECDPNTCPIYQKGECRPVGTLNFFIDGVDSLGVYQFDTSSAANIINLNGAMRALKEKFGKMNGVPLWLVREKASSNGHTYYRVFIKLRNETEKEPAEGIAAPEVTEDEAKEASEKTSQRVAQIAKEAIQNAQVTEKAPAGKNYEAEIYELFKKNGITKLQQVRELLSGIFDNDYSEAGKYIIRNMPPEKQKKIIEWFNKSDK